MTAESPLAAIAGHRRLPGRVVIVANPQAGGARRGLAAAVADRLGARGIAAAVETAGAPGAIRALARTCDADVLLVAGGDGSLAEAVRGLFDRPAPRPALGVVPAGTANVLARELALPRDPGALAALVARGATKPLLPGLANGRPFTLMAAAGLDAAIVAALDPAEKRRFGRIAYLLAAARILRAGEFPDVRIETDAGTLLAKWAVVTRARHYGGAFVIDPDADVTRPGLTLVALTEISARAALALAVFLATGRADAASRLQKRSVRWARFTGAAATQIDGDAFDPPPLEVTLAAETIDVLA
jgi:diacylglycerol kinase family enzyme